MRTLLIAVGLTFLSLSIASPSRRRTNYVLHEKRDAHPEEWEKRTRAAARELLPVRIALRQKNLEHAERYIMDVSDPASPNLGKHWSPEKVAETFMPTKETNAQVLQWLEEAGIHPTRISHSAGRNWLQFDAAVEEAEALFDTEYHVYDHTPSGGYRVACDSYGLPHELRDHIDFVTPTIQLEGLQPIPKQIMKRDLNNEFDDNGSIAVSQRAHIGMIEAAPAPPLPTGLTGLKNCSTLITIECLRAIYKFPAGSTKHKGNEIGIGEWADYLYQPDLQDFFKNFTKPQIPSDVFPEFISIDGGKVANKSVELAAHTIESGLDFQIAYSVSYPQGARLYQNGDSVNVNSVGTFNIFLDALDASYCTYDGGDSPTQDPHYPDPKKGGYKGPLQCGGAPRSNVISVSYGQIEVALTPAYQHRQCHEWMKLGLQGTSVLFASGDSGVANTYNAGFPTKCLAAHSNERLVNGTRFSPSFPVNCPYITAVGGTGLLTKSIYGGERAVNGLDKKDPSMTFFSGGGFSNYFEMPKYQSKAVTKYLCDYAPNYGPNVYNKSGVARGYPDVSALSMNIASVFRDTVFQGGGTSASTAAFAGIVTLLNEKRIDIGKGPIGFLNPTFYANPEAFNDVTVGSNPGCGTKGFPAAPGWDPVTGLGSPNFEKLEKIFTSLP